MPRTEIISNSAEDTIALGRRLAETLSPPVLVLMSGDLGSGKTTLSKGIVSGMGVAREEDVTSPTFTLVHLFHSARDVAAPGRQSPATKVYHVDLYRIDQPSDIDSLGLEDALAEASVILIEWPDRFSLHTDWPRITVQLEHLEGDRRRIIIEGPQPKLTEIHSHV
jgi:tRNA threonylcarbamoyladenosine biosynthesis protein TsaE